MEQQANPSLAPGAYDLVRTSELDQRIRLAGLEPEWKEIDEHAQPSVLAQHLSRLIARQLEEQPASRRLELVNEIAHDLTGQELGVENFTRLIALRQPEQIGVERDYEEVPSIPVGEPALITNASGEPSLGHEIRSELRSADRVDLVSAFIKWSGLRTMESELLKLRRRGVPLRVITTTYMGATEQRALDILVRKYGAEVKVNYEVNTTRLHAKAWLFTRNSRFDTAYVGSSNLSRSAMLDGVEWNVRLTRKLTPELIQKFGATFESYWSDDAFKPYNPDEDADSLRRALGEAGVGGAEGRETITLSGLEVRPYPHQEEILEDLEVERVVHDRHRNLVVAATGTGKTVVAALDYRRLCEQAGRDLRLLFVAHRREILEQSMRMYREVMADGEFGEPFFGGERPSVWRHVFATVQTLKSSVVKEFPADAFDVIVIDEFHHAAASSYRTILDHFRPGELLGLTATPERTDGFDVRDLFGGRIASELRLWDALKADLLCPFHYFGIHDGTDLTGITWNRGAYDLNELSNLYTGNDARSRIVLKQVTEKVLDPQEMRALGFCVGVAHAHYMARVFRNAGIKAVALSGDSPLEERRAALRDLTSGEINAVFTADLFNEGVDLPDVDTLLFLRPTESATLFLQQLGRGLRRTKDKAVLTVLDFVGNNRQDFRYEARFTAMTGIPRGKLERHIKEEFPFLPAGSQIILDRQATELVLDNVRRGITSRWSEIVAQLRSLGDVDLTTFLENTGIELTDILKNRSWTEARIDAGLPVPGDQHHDPRLLKRGRVLAHVDDMQRLDAYRRLVSDECPPYSELGDWDQRYARMLLYSLWPKRPDGHSQMFDDVRRDARLRFELREIFSTLEEKIRHIPHPLGGSLHETGLFTHARYKREEILAALDHAQPSRVPGNFREGVFWSEEWNTDSFLITLKKSDSEFTPTTMYEDYAISPTLFHWQSQSRTTVSSPTGQRYLNQREDGTHVLLFTRERSADEFGKGAPYMLLGTADYVTHEGEAPISITYKLDRAIPSDHFQIAAAVQVG